MPIEKLKELKQWVCVDTTRFKNGKIDKTPLTVSGAYASSTDPKTWNTYDNCIDVYQSVGFVFTKNDPFMFIDLDKPENKEQEIRHRQILSQFDTCTEYSYSQNGFHLILEGAIPKGVNNRELNIEMYSDSHYMLLTENYLFDKKIENRQHLTDQLFNLIDTTHKKIITKSEELKLPDTEIMRIASNAQNSDKFNMLYSGEWSENYESQSNADMALISILKFYTKNHPQIMRIFRSSKLGKRKKAARDDYLIRTINSAQIDEPPALDLSEFKTHKKTETKKTETKKTETKISFPAGLVGEVAQYVFDSSIKPVKEVSLISALALFSGLTGRAYNVSGTGLNTYLMLMGKTGIGKGGAARGIESIISKLSERIPGANQKIGASYFASGQALRAAVSEHNSFLSILGEFGLTLQQMTSDKAPSFLIEYKRMLLDLFDKSGHDQTLRAAKKASQENSNAFVKAPSFSLLTEGTPETFFSGLNLSNVSDGLLSRFIILEYQGGRPHDNLNRVLAIPEHIYSQLEDLTEFVLQQDLSDNVINITLTTNALNMYKQFSKKIDNKINNSNSANAELWNRAALNALKIAAILSVADNYRSPQIDVEGLMWAIDFISTNINNFANRFNTEVLDSTEYKQVGELRTIISQYISMSEETRMSYNVSKNLAQYDNIVPFNYIYKRLIRKSIFKEPANSKPSQNINNAINFTIESGHIEKIPATTLAELKTKTKSFAILKKL